MKKIKSFDDLYDRLISLDTQLEKIDKKLARKQNDFLDEIFCFLDKVLFNIKHKKGE